MEQASHLSATGTKFQSEFVIVFPRHSLAFDFWGRYGIVVELRHMHFVSYIVYHCKRLRIPAILPREAVATLGLYTAQELEPGITMEVANDWILPRKETDTITEEE
jgi:hypothetical protein